MTTISFTNSLGVTITFTETELINILGSLNSSNAYFTSGLNELVFIRISQGKLLLIDLNDNINRKLFEIYSFHYSVGNVFHLKLVHNDNALELNINDALISVGFSGTTPIATLESRYMKLYTNSNQRYLNTHDLVKNTGTFAYTPAELNTLVVGAGIVLSNDANNLTITANITSLADYYTRTEVDTLFNSYYNRTYLDAEFSTKADVANVYDRTQLYTQTETNNLLNNKQNNLSTLLGDDATTFKILNGTKIKALREGSNIQMSALTGGDEIQIEAVIPPTDLSNYYTKTEADTLLNGKLNTNNPTITGTVTHTHSSQPHYRLSTTATNPAVTTEFYIDRTSLDASLRSAFGMGDTSRGFFVWVNGGDRLNIGTNGNTTFSGNVTAPNLYDTTYINAALSTKANVADVYDRTQLYTQTETNNLLNNKQNSLSTVLGDDATTFQILNGTKIKALREGSNIQMSALNGGDEIEIEAVIPATDLSNYYTKTEADTLLASKEDTITSSVSVQNGLAGPSATLAAFSTHTALACDTAHDLEIRTNPSVNTTPDITISHLNQGVYCAGGITAPSASIASGSFTTSLAVSGTATFTNSITSNIVYQTALPAFHVRKQMAVRTPLLAQSRLTLSC